MAAINMTRAILGGLLAGLIINISETLLNAVVLARQVEEAVARMNLPPVGGSAIGVFVVMGFLLGIATVWLYAAIRSRYGPGPKTALCAGAAVWAFAYLYPAIGMSVMGMFPAGLTAVSLAWGLGELLIAAAAGGWVYKE